MKNLIVILVLAVLTVLVNGCSSSPDEVDSFLGIKGGEDLSSVMKRTMSVLHDKDATHERYAVELDRNLGAATMGMLVVNAGTKKVSSLTAFGYDTRRFGKDDVNAMEKYIENLLDKFKDVFEKRYGDFEEGEVNVIDELSAVTKDFKFSNAQITVCISKKTKGDITVMSTQVSCRWPEFASSKNDATKAL